MRKRSRIKIYRKKNRRISFMWKESSRDQKRRRGRGSRRSNQKKNKNEKMKKAEIVRIFYM